MAGNRSLPCVALGRAGFGICAFWRRVVLIASHLGAVLELCALEERRGGEDLDVALEARDAAQVDVRQAARNLAHTHGSCTEVRAVLVTKALGSN